MPGVTALNLSIFGETLEGSSDWEFNTDGESFLGVSVPSVDNALGVRGGVLFRGAKAATPSVSLVSSRNEAKLIERAEMGDWRLYGVPGEVDGWEAGLDR